MASEVANRTEQMLRVVKEAGDNEEGGADVVVIEEAEEMGVSGHEYASSAYLRSSIYDIVES